MGGVLVNGMGWKESFNPVRTLGRFFCPSCNATHNIAVMEVSRKVAVFWVPTVTFDTKYAVACENCKTGFYIEASVAQDLIYGRAELIEFGKDGATWKKKETDAPAPAETTEEFSFCHKCGAKLQNDALFCSKCGTKKINAGE